MEPNEINITIHGLPGSGKSTVAQVILRALIDAGFDNLTFDDPGIIPRSSVTDRVTILRHKGATINIETHQRFNPGDHLDDEQKQLLAEGGLTGDDCK